MDHGVTTCLVACHAQPGHILVCESRFREQGPLRTFQYLRDAKHFLPNLMSPSKKQEKKKCTEQEDRRGFEADIPEKK